MKNFQDKVAVITGSGSGMGRELAIELAQAGANIALVEWNAVSYTHLTLPTNREV